MDSPLILFGFLSVFHLVGAATMGSAVRDIWRGLRSSHGKKLKLVPKFFLLIWSALFGCMPLILGLQLVPDERRSLFVFGEIAVWSGAFLVALLARNVAKDFLQAFQQREVTFILVGGIGVLIGAVVAALGRRLLWGGLFLVGGMIVMIVGLRRLFQEPG